ncbi:NAD(P)H-binding protein [Hydrogenophaga sp. BPS33]|uniref:NAD(P)H-binding protein n=1 Tax=Hydrogenophaga sp. BPS33 TaxID=2651974 RepID=UPI0013579FFB|nr:NAD(P)H-binding protein [Hydrogenophaga sp. BPS33]
MDACLVTGATGGIGRGVALRLAGQVPRLRLLVRGSSSSPPVDAEVVQGDFDDLPSMARAFAGMRTVFLYTPVRPDARLLQTAAEQGVRHVVLLSSASVAKVAPGERNPVAERHRAMERYVRDAGLGSTCLRPDTLASNCLSWAEEIRTHRRVSVPYPSSLRNPIHEDDVALIAALAMLDGDSLRSRSLLLTGPAPLSIRDQVAAIGRASGQAIECREIAAQDAIDRMAQGPGALALDVARRLVAYMEKTTREVPAVASDFFEAAGQAPKAFSEWAAEHAEAFRPPKVPTLAVGPAPAPGTFHSEI